MSKCQGEGPVVDPVRVRTPSPTDTYATTGIEEDEVIPVRNNNFGATIFTGPLILLEGKKCKVFDITGRTVAPDKIKPGIYFIEIDGVITQKLIKIR